MSQKKFKKSPFQVSQIRDTPNRFQKIFRTLKEKTLPAWVSEKDLRNFALLTGVSLVGFKSRNMMWKALKAASGLTSLVSRAMKNTQLDEAKRVVIAQAIPPKQQKSLLKKIVSGGKVSLVMTVLMAFLYRVILWEDVKTIARGKNPFVDFNYRQRVNMSPAQVVKKLSRKESPKVQDNVAMELQSSLMTMNPAQPIANIEGIPDISDRSPRPGSQDDTKSILPQDMEEKIDEVVDTTNATLEESIKYNDMVTFLDKFKELITGFKEKYQNDLKTLILIKHKQPTDTGYFTQWVQTAKNYAMGDTIKIDKLMYNDDQCKTAFRIISDLMIILLWVHNVLVLNYETWKTGGGNIIENINLIYNDIMGKNDRKLGTYPFQIIPHKFYGQNHYNNEQDYLYYTNYMLHTLKNVTINDKYDYVKQYYGCKTFKDMEGDNIEQLYDRGVDLLKVFQQGWQINQYTLHIQLINFYYCFIFHYRTILETCRKNGDDLGGYVMHRTQSFNTELKKVDQLIATISSPTNRHTCNKLIDPNTKMIAFFT